MEEIWRDIKGYEGIYQVSNLGRIKSLDRVRKQSHNSIAFIKGKVLKVKIDKYGYPTIGLRNGTKQRFIYVSRLVYEAFKGAIPKGMQVNHINEIKTDNRPENLNLMTPKENTNWGTRTTRAVRHAKRPVTQILYNGTEYFTFFSATDAEKELNICRQDIIKCCKGEREYAGGFKWAYCD